MSKKIKSTEITGHHDAALQAAIHRANVLGEKQRLNIMIMPSETRAAGRIFICSRRVNK